MPPFIFIGLNIEVLENLLEIRDVASNLHASRVVKSGLNSDANHRSKIINSLTPVEFIFLMHL
jgi:hypothetical protein